MMQRLNSVRLKVWLPVAFGLGYLVLVVLAFSMEYLQRSGEVQEQADRQIRALCVQASVPIKRALEQHRFRDDIDVAIGSLSVREDVRVVVLSDANGVILNSSRYAWRGRSLSEVLPGSSAFSGDPSNLQVAALPKGLLAAMPIQYHASGEQIREQRQAMLWIHLDTQPLQYRMLAQALDHMMWLLMVGLLPLLGIAFLSLRYVGRPLLQLTQLAGRLTGGDYQASLEVHGQGEIAELADSLRQMGASVHQAIGELRSSESRLSVTLDSIGDAVMVTDTLGAVTRFNAEAERLTGWPADEAIGRSVIEVFRIINSETHEPAEHPVARVLREGVVVGLANHTSLIARDGSEYQIADSAAPIRERNGDVAGVIMVFQDVTERYRLQTALENAHDRLAALTQALPDPCFILSEQGEYLEVLGGSDELLAIERQQLPGRRIADVLPAETAALMTDVIRKTIRYGKPTMLEYSLDLASGKTHFEGHIVNFDRFGCPAVIWLARDITRRKNAEEDIRRLAKFDPLTGLPNRRLLEDQVRQAIARGKRREAFGALLFIDLDHFKQVNDSLGHLLGDELLVNIADRLRGAVRTEDLAARFGGDEFVILLQDLGQDAVQAAQQAESVAIKLHAASTLPVALGEHKIEVGMSIGIVVFPDEADAGELLKRADIAMYRAKETGRDRICFFSKELQLVAEERLSIKNALRVAIQANELRLFVQPRLNAAGQWIGGEVLVRWQHPQKGLLLPNAFIPIAEQCGLIEALDRWVLTQSIRRLADLGSDLPESFKHLSVNLTEPLMMRSGFSGELISWMNQAALEPERVELEITERVLVSDHNQAANVMTELRDRGVRFSVDDFGTGCSSLRYLQRLPLDTVKIDRSFIDRIPGHHGDASIVETIIGMAGHLSLGVVAEGVETAAQREFLIKHGCTEFQGFLFARPMPWDQFCEALRRQNN